MTFLIYIHVRNGTKNEFWECATSKIKNARKIGTFLNYRTSEINWRIDFFFWGGRGYDIEHCHFLLAIFYQTFNLTLVKKFTINCKIYWWIILLRKYSTKPSYIFQLKRELKVWKYIFNLFHFEMLIQNRNPTFRPMCLFVSTFHEYEARFVFGFRLDYKLSLFTPFLYFCVKLFCVLFMCYNQYKLNNSSDPR
jgi:hypothetical protein